MVAREDREQLVEEIGVDTDDLAHPDGTASGAEADIRIRREGAAGVVTLNRPRALNALTDAMRSAMAKAFPVWSRDPEVYAVLIDSTSDRAFCAGGDVREMAEWVRTRKAEMRRALAAEYALNWMLECFTKPTISLIDGVVMGSGVGISLYGTHRVAGERYRFAMPETGIGLFPDDGLCWTFAQMPDEIGMYLALTGRPIGRADAFRLGLVTHCIRAASFADIRAAIRDADPVDPVLDGLHEDQGPGELGTLAPAIARCFSADTVEAVMARLDAERGAARPWAEQVRGELSRRSPLSLKVTHRAVRSARDLDLRTTLMQDYRLACRFVEGHDFSEGVRASLIDRDQAPKWQPAHLEDVTEAMVDGYFAPLSVDEFVLATRADMQGFQR
ncbi:MAG: enoyl-CoA hydratase/isomerase family protein [Hyphomicrobiaceae bacterium]|nr:MAG: enoyl-CoA hydratase/isomerase family protein [Hyphomicrobiaceae bacterium]KAB2851811.1 MAG: enoyl-CoA hydratase/isomerase family protein [Hyphomicrobiaceae bacterium]